MEKVLIITYYWPPSGGPGVQRWLKFARYLPNEGYEPVILTVDPEVATYPIGDDTLIKQIPEGLKVIHTYTREPYSLYKKITGRKQVPYSGFANEQKTGLISTFSRFIRGNLFVPDARVGWNPFALAKARQLIHQHNIRIVITTSPPHSTQLVGLKLKKEFPGIRWIADLRDPWTDIFYYRKMLHLPLVKKWDAAMERDVLNTADVVITVSDFIRQIFLSKIKQSSRANISVITNGYDPDDFREVAVYSPGESFSISYIGTLADDYDLSGLLNPQGKKTLKLPENMRLNFTGSITGKWKQIIKEGIGFQPSFSEHTGHREAIQRMQQSSALLLVIPRIEQNKGIVTGKIFEYMAAGRPIIGIGPPDGDAAAILNETHTGIMFHYDDSGGIWQYINQLASDPASFQPDRKAVENYSRIQLTKKLTVLFS